MDHCLPTLQWLFPFMDIIVDYYFWNAVNLLLLQAKARDPSGPIAICDPFPVPGKN